MGLLWFVLTGYGLTQLIVYGSIFEKSRSYIKSKSSFLGELVHCPMCTGFWVGVLLFGLNPFTELFNFELNLINSLICGWLGSGTSYLMNMIFTDKGINIFHNHGEAPEQGCQSCGEPYNRMGLEEMVNAYEHNGGRGDEQK